MMSIRVCCLRYSLFQEDPDKPAEIGEPEFVDVAVHKKQCKGKPSYEEIFENLPAETMYVDTLPEEQKTCMMCGIAEA